MDTDPVQMANEELRAKLTSIQIEFQQEKSKVGAPSPGRAPLSPPRPLSPALCTPRRAHWPLWRGSDGSRARWLV